MNDLEAQSDGQEVGHFVVLNEEDAWDKFCEYIEEAGEGEIVDGTGHNEVKAIFSSIWYWNPFLAQEPFSCHGVLRRALDFGAFTLQDLKDIQQIQPMSLNFYQMQRHAAFAAQQEIELAS